MNERDSLSNSCDAFVFALEKKSTKELRREPCLRVAPDGGDDDGGSDEEVALFGILQSLREVAAVDSEEREGDGELEGALLCAWMGGLISRAEC